MLIINPNYVTRADATEATNAVLMQILTVGGRPAREWAILLKRKMKRTLTAFPQCPQTLRKKQLTERSQNP